MIFETLLRHPLPSSDLLSYIFDHPQYDQDEPLYVDVHCPSRSISCNQARRVIRRLIAGLRVWGVSPGDCVAIHSFNDIYYSMLVLAIIGVGGIFTGTNPAYTTLELAHHYKASRTRFVIAEPELLDPVQGAMKQLHMSPEHLRVFNVHDQPVPAGLQAWTHLLDHEEADWVRFYDAHTCRRTAAGRLFSSGTTGLPKAVTITHQNLIAQHELVFEVHPKPYRVSCVMPLPIFHAAAAPLAHISVLKAGQPIYMMRRFDLLGYLRAVETHQATEAILVPPIVIAIVMNPLSSERGYLKSLRFACCGAAPLDRDMQARFRKLMAPDAPFTQVWGMTETCCIAMHFPYPEPDDGSVGRLGANMEAKLVNEQGENISAYNVRGELCVRGPTVTPGYFNNEAANAESFDDDGWFHTGDIAYCDSQTRKWYIVDRKKELIKVRGFQVAPPELEAVLLSHPLIVDVAVIGLRGIVPDEELPRAYVVRRPGGEALTEDEVKEHLLSRLAKYKALTGGVRFVDAIPKNASGKILKKVLREESQKEIGQKVKL
ncbi:hypothetical protein EYZ11_003322 [Aspergillus tanneri]|uniref:Uncharacterized protein n=1 Tax=Aspergillus tanneri TaxID=1220188 RepID=A0A4S3JNM4_9EURO|nr:uncharacterized protein ATNIH1004_001751 [Aspergillus tanneri]KAA8652842.1 hypothetical protein ATNIH1004_001751 [Aspergillus tanneri]THC97213.1 hypothetical protein EYZ11_003322 [Aspergillus tanneri]